jgi:hypothetical protein
MDLGFLLVHGSLPAEKFIVLILTILRRFNRKYTRYIKVKRTDCASVIKKSGEQAHANNNFVLLTLCSWEC